MHPYSQLLENVRPTLRGADVFSFEWFVRTTRLACEAHDWPTALDRSMRLSEYVRHDTIASAALAGVYLCAACDGHLVGRLGAAKRLLPESSAVAAEILKPALIHLLRHEHRAADRALELIAESQPLAEVMAVVAQRHEAKGRWAEAFDAWTLAEATLPAATLRAGAAAFRAGRLAEGRHRVRGADIPPTDLVWVAVSQTSSAGYFDRLRGYDLVRDALDDERRALPGLRPPRAALREAVMAMLASLPPSINAQEFERLEDLVQIALDEPERGKARAALHAGHLAHIGQGAQAAAALEILKAMEDPQGSSVEELVTRVREGRVAPSEIVTHMASQGPQVLWAVWWHIPVELHAAFDSAFLAWLGQIQRPSTGWSPVAEAFLARNLTVFGALAAERAYHHDEWVEPATAERVLDTLLYQLGQTQDDQALHVWLKRAKHIYEGDGSNPSNASASRP